MTMTLSATETSEYLHERWEKEFTASALEVLVEQAMGECPRGMPDLGLALAATFKAHLIDAEMVEWAARVSGDVLSFEDYVSRETGE